MGLRGIAEQGFHFGRTIVTRISTHNDLSRLEHIGKITLFRQERSETVGLHGFDYRMLVGPLAHELQRQSENGCRSAHEIAYSVLAPAGDDVIVRGILLEHEPLHFDVITGMPPIAAGIHVAEVQAIGKPEAQTRQSTRDLTGNEGFTAQR